MNSARELYRGTYSRINSIDHLIKNCRLKFPSWKYWHLPMLHAMLLVIAIAYDIYLEVAEGSLSIQLTSGPSVTYSSPSRCLSTIPRIVSISVTIACVSAPSRRRRTDPKVLILKNLLVARGVEVAQVQSPSNWLFKHLNSKEPSLIGERIPVYVVIYIDSINTLSLLRLH